MPSGKKSKRLWVRIPPATLLPRVGACLIIVFCVATFAPHAITFKTMAHSVYEVHTFKCSTVDCKNEATRSGQSHHIHDELSDLGWSLDKTILGRQHLDLCPDCTKEIAQFLFKEDK